MGKWFKKYKKVIYPQDHKQVHVDDSFSVKAKSINSSCTALSEHNVVD